MTDVTGGGVGGKPKPNYKSELIEAYNLLFYLDRTMTVRRFRYMSGDINENGFRWYERLFARRLVRSLKDLSDFLYDLAEHAARERFAIGRNIEEIESSECTSCFYDEEEMRAIRRVVALWDSSATTFAEMKDAMNKLRGMANE